MGKAKHNKTEKRLQKIVDQHKEESPLKLLTSAKIFVRIEELCRKYLDVNRYDTPSKELVSQLTFTFRQEAIARFGHDTLETFALAKLVQKGPSLGFIDKPPRVDSITWINNYPSKNSRLSSDQQEAAEKIRDVWEAFGKFLWVTGRSYGGGGGGSRSSATSPLDVMGDDLWKHHQTIFTPWCNIASKTSVNRRMAGGGLTIAAITFKILVEDFYPEAIDKGFGLVKGTALKALKAGLSAYFSPERLVDWGKPPPQPQGSPLAGDPGSAAIPTPAKGKAPASGAD